MIVLRELWWAVSDKALDTKDAVEEWFFDEKKSLYGAAACRIILGLSILLLLIGNFSTRQLWVGPASVWADPARAISNFPEMAILDGASSGIVTLVYLFVLFSTFAFTIGWHTRVATIFTLIGYIAITSQNPTVGNQADNIIRLTLLWFLLIDSSEHWALDSRRRISKPAMAVDSDVTALQHAWNSHETVPAWLSNSFHNIGIAGLAAQTILIYMTAGLSKIAESSWRHGTALYSTMQLPDYRPFPAISDLFSHSRFLLAVITYAILLSQLFFAPLLLNKITRTLILALAITVNVFFGLIMSLPVSSLAIIAATGIFISGPAYEAVAGWIGDELIPVRYWLADRTDGLRDRWDDLRDRVDEAREERANRPKKSAEAVADDAD